MTHLLTQRHQAISQAGPQSGREPVFILAPARSYSTVTLALLAGHPEVYAFPEMLLFTADTVGGLLHDPAQPSRWPPEWGASMRSGILRAVADLREGSQAEQAIGRAERWLTQRSDWPPTRLMDHLLTLAQPRIGLEKSPQTVMSAQALKACLESYPRARYIHLTRHPVTTQRSMHNHWRQRYQAEKALVARSASAWYLGHVRIVRALAELPAEQWLRVRAEDVLREPRVWLPRLLDWLGLSSNGDLITRMTRTENWRFANTGPSGLLFGGDPTFMLAPALRPVLKPGPVVFDPSWGLSGEMCDRMAALAGYLGY